LTKQSKAFAKALASRMDGVEVIGDAILVSPTRHIVRGFWFERTPNHGFYYLWLFVVPLFGPTMKNVSLNYSTRISIDCMSPVNINNPDVNFVAMWPRCCKEIFEILQRTG